MDLLTEYTSELVARDGILFAKKESAIAYPGEDNSICFQLEDNSFWFQHRNNCIYETVKRYCPDSLFFDIGGGNGYVAKGLEDRGIKTVLIEPGINGCLNARKRNLSHVVCSTLENASFRKNSVPAIGLFDVVEHIEDDLGFLKSAHSYLVDKGYIFITVPAFNMLWSNEDETAMHYRRYTTGSMASVLQQAGFTVVYSTYIFFFLPLPVLLFRSIPSRLGLHKNSNNLAKYKNEHNRRKGLADSVLNKMLDYELNRIKAGKTMPVGGSVFMVAQKLT